MDKKRGAGILIPVFSLRSEEGLGIGEFSDLMLLADLAEKSGFSLIQILPVFDTTVTKTWTDSYCYSAISMFALNPIYLRIEKAFSSISPEILEEIRYKKKDLNALEDVDYEAVYKTKIDFCLRLYEKGIEPIPSEFLEENKDWLRAYAAFSVLRDAFGTGDFSTWPEYKEGTQEVIDKICSPFSPYQQAVWFYYFLQFKLHEQFKEASDYANSKGILLKGDFPVGVHIPSVETWTTPELFLFKRRLGAPPDCFNTKGQNWGLPAYNWEEIKKTSYSWFVKRLQHMQKYCQVIRIDHILGYFRFWEVEDKYSRGALGYFNPSLSIHLPSLPPDMQENIARYIEPFISEELLKNRFGVEKERVKERFLEVGGCGGYIFKKDWSHQRRLDFVKDISDEERVFLYELHENVLLIKDPENEDLVYPRIGFESTYSFSMLDEDQKNTLIALSTIYFSEKEEEIWEKSGLEKLKCFKENTSMEICAEDLGMVPKCTKGVLEKLGFLTLHVQRMPKIGEEEFSLPSTYEYLSVCSPSNHDTSTLRLWWEENPDLTQRFYECALKGSGRAPKELTEDVCQKIIQMHLDSESKWVIILMQDLLAMSSSLKRKEAEKERINDPSIVHFYWKWRLHKSLEELLEESFFSTFLKEMVVRAKRN